MAELVNFDVLNYDVGAGVLLLEIGVGLVVPLLVVVFPVPSGTRLTVREAISNNGSARGGVASGTGWMDQLLHRIKGLSWPMLLSLRNTFRRKGRLAMTLITLTLGEAIFIGVMSVQQSLLLTLDDALKYWDYDISVGFRGRIGSKRSSGRLCRFQVC